MWGTCEVVHTVPVSLLSCTSAYPPLFVLMPAPLAPNVSLLVILLDITDIMASEISGCGSSPASPLRVPGCHQLREDRAKSATGGVHSLPLSSQASDTCYRAWMNRVHRIVERNTKHAFAGWIKTWP